MLILIVIAAFCATLVGGVFALRMKDRLHLILGFSAGAVIGVALFDLIPEALELGGGTAMLLQVMGFVALGFVAYLIIDRIYFMHCHEEGEVHHHRGSFMAGSLSFHSFLDGVAIGVAFNASPAVGIAVAVAVLAHDISDGINTVALILRNGGGKKAVWKWLLIDAAAPAIGAIIASFFSFDPPVASALLAIFAGCFLYIGTSDLLPESHHAHPTAWTSIATIIGLALMYVVVSMMGI